MKHCALFYFSKFYRDAILDEPLTNTVNNALKSALAYVVIINLIADPLPGGQRCGAMDFTISFGDASVHRQYFALYDG